jgi:diguanylate cyclase (GGDEF)-like protein
MAEDALSQRYERLVKGRELVRRAALLLSADITLQEAFDQLATLLSAFVDASIVQVAVTGESEARIAYIFRDGVGGSPEDPTVVPDGTTARVLRTGESVLYHGVDDWPAARMIHLKGRPAQRAASAVFVPIPFGGRMVGVLSVQSVTPEAYDEDDRVMLETCALYLGARINDEQQRQAREVLTRMATTDALTGLPNRRAFDEALAREWRRCGRSHSKLSLAMIDVDLFKRFNDAYGHVAGDACLRQVAQAVAHHANRPGDIAARYGGEEFALILPESDELGSFQLGEALCATMRSLAIPHEGSSLGFASASVGVATVIPDADGDPQRLIRAADAMLYLAKRGGRNRVVAEGFHADGPAVVPRVIVRYALPQYATPIFGRAEAVKDLRALLGVSALVTIFGNGGIGKTRLAVQTALQLANEQSDGAWFADLTGLVDEAGIVKSIAAAIGVELPSSGDAVAELLLLLRSQQMLLVMDNCERDSNGAAARVAAAIAGNCPQVSVLATSREPLGVSREKVYRLEPLDLDSAVELFVSRAQRDDREPYGSDDRELIEEICRRLDCVPLAIELAAARAHVMSLEALHLRLPHRQTLPASIAWSYELLSEKERAIFRRLGVFTGSFGLDAATRVAAFGDVVPWEALDGVNALIEMSMLARVGDGSDRYRMLDSIRQHALQKLYEAGEEGGTRRAHAQAFADLSAQVSATYGYTTQDAWLARFEPDVENFRAALDWAIASDVVMAARIVGNLAELWDYCGLVPENLRRAEVVLASLDGCDDDVMLPVYLAVAFLANASRQYRRSLEAGERALEIARRGGDPFLIARALRNAGGARYVLREDPELAKAELAEALAFFRTHDNVVRLASTLYTYGSALDDPEGRPMILEALALVTGAGWPRFIVAIDMNLAERDCWAGDITAACDRTRRAISIVRSRSRRTTFDLTILLDNLASYSCLAGEVEDANAASSEAATIAFAHEQNYGLTLALQNLAYVRAVRGDARGAARLVGYVDACYARLRSARERTEALVYERLLALLRQRLDGATLAVELEAGAALSQEAAYDLAMEPMHAR